MFLIVGLGNPGRKYKSTRHNVGQKVAEKLAKDLGKSFREKYPRAKFCKALINQQEIAIVLLKVFMNNSGSALARLCKFFQITPSELIVIHDDLDLSFAEIRIKKKGGSGGHKGLDSIIEALGRDDFIRIRVGLGRPPENIDPSDFVLSVFTPQESSEMKVTIAEAAQGVKEIILHGVESAMKRYNRKKVDSSQ